MRLIATPCTITPVTLGAKDENGNEALTDGTPVDTFCHVNERSTSEEQIPEQFTETLATVYLLPTETIAPLYQIDVDGRTWEVSGAPAQRRRAPTAAVHHLEVLCREVV